jgi:hypothetical protein
MGLSNAMSGGIILFGIMYVIFVFMGITDKSTSVHEALFERSELDAKMANTSVELRMTGQLGDGNEFGFRMINNNLEKLWDFKNFDVIITYENTGIIYTETLTYADCPVDVGTWCLGSFFDDYFQPGILNPGETVNINVKINNDLEPDTILFIVVSTPNGVVSTITTII